MGVYPYITAQIILQLLVTSSGLLIAVAVVRDAFYNLDAELKLHEYDQPLLVH